MAEVVFNPLESAQELMRSGAPCPSRTRTYSDPRWDLSSHQNFDAAGLSQEGLGAGGGAIGT